MCLLCIEISKGNMNVKEVAKAYIEQSDMEDGHIYELMGKIVKHYGHEGFREVGEEISKEYEKRYKNEANCNKS